jgi:hypothetical protein
MLYAICITINNFAFGWFLAEWVVTHLKGEEIPKEVPFIVIATGVMLALDVFGVIH